VILFNLPLFARLLWFIHVIAKAVHALTSRSGLRALGYAPNSIDILRRQTQRRRFLRPRRIWSSLISQEAPYYATTTGVLACFLCFFTNMRT
jgi:hypothetical protein